MRQLFGLVLRCVRAGRAKPIIRPSEQIAAHSYAAGIDLAEAQGAFTALAKVLWRQLAGALTGEQLVQALGNRQRSRPGPRRSRCRQALA